ncbi:hypothetical protein, partial [Rivihabitans pingtungensis]|uniref:hypothetical protein n=1 Tax=Rivihabitans pingtungensis TaxID=1054498 RepID=UPI001B871649
RLHLSVVFSVKDQLLSESEPGNVSGLFRFVSSSASAAEMRTIRTDPETVNTPQHTFLQKNAKNTIKP